MIAEPLGLASYMKVRVIRDPHRNRKIWFTVTVLRVTVSVP